MARARGEQTLQVVRQQVMQLPARERNFLVALSGGVDSTALLLALGKLRESIDLKVTAAHFNHRLRESADRDAEFARSLCERVDVAFLSGSARSVPERENVEAWARLERYAFLERCREHIQASWVVTGHHQQDQAETLLFRAITGRLLTSAMTIAARDPERRVFRPLLGLSREEIAEFVGNCGESAVVDETNFDLQRARNRLRLNVLPELRVINPRTDELLAETAACLNADEAFLTSIAAEKARQLQRITDGAAVREFFLDLPDVLRVRTLRELLEQQVDIAPGYFHLRELVQFLLSGAVRFEQDFPGGITVRFTLRRGLEFFRRSGARSGFVPVRVAFPGSIALSGGEHLHVELSDEALDYERLAPSRLASPMEEWFDADALQVSEAVIRPVRPGDRMRVFSRGERAVKKLLQEAGIAPENRLQLPVVEVDDEIIWIPGVCRGERAPLTTSTSRVLKFRMELP